MGIYREREGGRGVGGGREKNKERVREWNREEERESKEGERYHNSTLRISVH